MVELGTFPAGGAVALPAALTELTRMGVIPRVAANTFQRRGLQFSSRTGRLVAGSTIQFSMPFLQRETSLVVIKICPVDVHAIMAGQTVLPKYLYVSLKEGFIQLAVAAATSIPFERGEIPIVAIRTGKCAPSCPGLVPLQ